MRETSKCYDLDPNLFMQVNIKIVFPSLLEFLNKYDENGITPNMTNHFVMEIPLSKYLRYFSNKNLFKYLFLSNSGLNEYIKEFLRRKS